MLTVLQGILNFILTIGQLIINLLSSIVTLITFIPRSLSYLTNVIAYMPPSITAFMLLGLSLSTILFILSLK